MATATPLFDITVGVSSGFRDTASPVRRSIAIHGHKTSVSLEDDFWTDLKNIAHTQQTTMSELVTKINQTREGNLPSAIRLFVLHFRNGMDVTKAGLSTLGAEGRPAR